MLLLTKDTAEWIEPSADGAPAYASSPVLGATADDCARAAVEAAKAAGSKSRACVLALGHGLVELRNLSLPDLPQAELARVFPRRAGATLEADPKDVLYAALPFALDKKGGAASGDATASSEQKWLLVTQRRSFATQLALALRRESIKPRRVVSARLARLSTAQHLQAKDSGACIVLDVDSESVVVSLIAGGALVHQGRLSGSFDSVPTMALSLIQEIKSFEAYWRKLSRGSGVGAVAIIGLDLERAPLFRSAVEHAVPDAKVTLSPDVSAPVASGPSRDKAGRLASLEACTGEGAFDLDLSVPIPARYGYLIALGTSLTLITGGLGTAIHGRMSTDLDRLVAGSCSLEAQAADLEKLVEQNAASDAAVDALRLECERMLVAGSVGVPLDAALRDTFGALQGRASLVSFSAKYDGLEDAVRWSGLTDNAPLEATRCLTEIGAALERSPCFGEVAVDPPQLDYTRADEPDAPIAFEAHASWEEKP